MLVESGSNAQLGSASAETVRQESTEIERENTPAEKMKRLVDGVLAHSQQEIERRTEAFKPKDPEQERKAAIRGSVAGLVLSAGAGIALAGTGAWIPALAGAAVSTGGSWLARKLYSGSAEAKGREETIAKIGESIVQKEQELWDILTQKAERVKELEEIQSADPRIRQEIIRLQVEIVEGLDKLQNPRKRQQEIVSGGSETHQKWLEIEKLKKDFRDKSKGQFWRKLGWSVLGGVAAGGLFSVVSGIMEGIKSQTLHHLASHGAGLGKEAAQIPGMAGHQELVEHGGQIVVKYTDTAKTAIDAIKSQSTVNALERGTKLIGALEHAPRWAVKYIAEYLKDPLIAQGMHGLRNLTQGVTQQFHREITTRLLVLLGAFGLSGGLSAAGSKELLENKSELKESYESTGQLRGYLGQQQRGAEREIAGIESVPKAGQRWEREVAGPGGSSIRQIIEIRDIEEDGETTVVDISRLSHVGDYPLPASVTELRADWQLIPGSGSPAVSERRRDVSGIEVVDIPEDLLPHGGREFVRAVESCSRLPNVRAVIARMHEHPFEVVGLKNVGGEIYAELVPLDEHLARKRETVPPVLLSEILSDEPDHGWKWSVEDVSGRRGHRHGAMPGATESRTDTSDQEAEIKEHRERFGDYEGRIYNPEAKPPVDQRKRFIEAVRDIVGKDKGPVRLVSGEGRNERFYQIDPSINQIPKDGEIEAVNAFKMGVDIDGELKALPEQVTLRINDILSPENNYGFYIIDVDSPIREKAEEWAEENGYRLWGRIDQNLVDFNQALSEIKMGSLPALVVQTADGRYVEVTSKEVKDKPSGDFGSRFIGNLKDMFRIHRFSRKFVVRELGQLEGKLCDFFDYSQHGITGVDYWFTNKDNDQEFAAASELTGRTSEHQTRRDESGEADVGPTDFDEPAGRAATPPLPKSPAFPVRPVEPAVKEPETTETGELRVDESEAKKQAIEKMPDILRSQDTGGNYLPVWVRSVPTELITFNAEGAPINLHVGQKLLFGHVLPQYKMYSFYDPNEIDFYRIYENNLSKLAQCVQAKPLETDGDTPPVETTTKPADTSGAEADDGKDQPLTKEVIDVPLRQAPGEEDGSADSGATKRKDEEKLVFVESKPELELVPGGHYVTSQVIISAKTMDTHDKFSKPIGLPTGVRLEFIKKTTHGYKFRLLELIGNAAVIILTEAQKNAVEPAEKTLSPQKETNQQIIEKSERMPTRRDKAEALVGFIKEGIRNGE